MHSYREYCWPEKHRNAMKSDVIDIITRFYDPDSRAFAILIEHGTLVGNKALKIGRRLSGLNPDRVFLEEAAMLHDIGMFLTDAPVLDCHGKDPYIRHGLLGGRLLSEMGLPKHARVCESHVGVGLSATDITGNNLPLPVRDMCPESLEEQIICYADKFFSKNGSAKNGEKSVEQILEELKAHGKDKQDTFLDWVERFKC